MSKLNQVKFCYIFACCFRSWALFSTICLMSYMIFSWDFRQKWHNHRYNYAGICYFWVLALEAIHNICQIMPVYINDQWLLSVSHCYSLCRQIVEVYLCTSTCSLYYSQFILSDWLLTDWLRRAGCPDQCDSLSPDIPIFHCFFDWLQLLHFPSCVLQ